MEAQLQWLLIELALCGVQQRRPDRTLLQEMDWQKIYHACRWHSIGALCATAVEAALNEPDAWQMTKTQQAVWKDWQQERLKSLRKTALMGAERDALQEFLERQGIWYLPLKGIVLQDLYPQPGTRQMADNDILFDAAYRETVRDWFCARGYTVESYGKSDHDVYQKPPVFNFEMHNSLFSSVTHKKAWVDYYASVRGRLQPVAGRRCELAFTPEDFYVYYMVHAAKHHDGSGTGLRTLMDELLYLRRYEATLDWSYIERQLQQLEILEWEYALRCAAQQLRAWQGQRMETFVATLAPEIQILLKQLLTAGTYGTIQIRVEHKLHEMQPPQTALTRRTKLRYVWRRLVPDRTFFREYYPFFDRHPWLIPFGIVYRVGKALCRKAPLLWQELNYVWKIR